MGLVRVGFFAGFKIEAHFDALVGCLESLTSGPCWTHDYGIYPIDRFVYILYKSVGGSAGGPEENHAWNDAPRAHALIQPAR